jgi:pyruvate dehydrogenase E2 component (dihydrolipoamide acetyltransferase)
VATEVKLPRLGQGMESGTIVKWLKSEGEPVQKGEPLYELDTDMVTQEVEAEASGVLLKIAVTDGEVEVGHTIAFIGERGEAVVESPGGEAPGEAPAPAEPERQAEPPARGPEPQSAAPATTNGRVKASPLARRIARERGIDLSSLVGTGPEGRIVAQDLERAEAAAPAAALERPQDDRAAADAGLDGAGVPADGRRRHDARERARPEPARAEP